ncbi:MRNA cap guanine-N7 methyltransferase [Phytophthora palmivora]|uniref:mRNA (guanine-N(7))-methyltransferase n=1 Tax=Phytophthora palmivora TaxID=4796 RepID=A0A2P4X178_9STRA|nr:MRNA cap guanine-N7 methyltransferase [Phytophthora palmivora]
MGTLEVSEEPLPPEWEVAMSRSKNMPYYYNAQTKKVYWVDDELPRGWSHQFDRDGRRFYFHVKDKTATISYDKPVLRPASSPSPPPPVAIDVASPEPLPVPAPSYDDSESPRAPSPSIQDSGEPPRLVRKKSNSLMDLLSPGPPALGAGQTQEESPREPSRTMHISNLVSSPQRTEDRASGTKRSYDSMSRDHDEIQREKDPDAAAAFYNQLQRSAQSDRADSLLFHMRALNNWVKSILINEYSRREGDRVLDLACGKGGDLMKWTKRNLSLYVGVDIAQKSLEDAVERYTSFSRGGRGGDRDRKKTEVQFIQGDLGVVDLLRDEMHCWSEQEGWHDAVPLPNSAVGNFSIVSVQFSFHYMFGDAQRASRFFSTVHELLADGGVLIATTVDPNKLLMKYFQGLRPPAKEREDQEANKPDVSIVDEKKREVCCIRFDAATRAQLSGPGAAAEGSFGLRYNFTLRDRVEDDAEGGGGQAVDLPEYLVPDDLLAKLLLEHGFELLLKQNFHHFIQQRKEHDRNRTLLEKMHVTNIRGSISDAEWDIAGLYQVLAFKKSY